MSEPIEFKIYIISKDRFVQEILSQIYDEECVISLPDQRQMINEFEPECVSALVCDEFEPSEFVENLLPVIRLVSNGIKSNQSNITKPFYYSELKKKIDAIIDNAKGAISNVVGLRSNIYLNKLKRKLLVMDCDELKFFDLTSKEVELLNYIANKKNKSATKNEILKEVFGYNYQANTHTVETHISRIRNKDSSLEDLFILSANKYSFKEI